MPNRMTQEELGCAYRFIIRNRVVYQGTSLRTETIMSHLVEIAFSYGRGFKKGKRFDSPIPLEDLDLPAWVKYEMDIAWLRGKKEYERMFLCEWIADKLGTEVLYISREEALKTVLSMVRNMAEGYDFMYGQQRRTPQPFHFEEFIGVLSVEELEAVKKEYESAWKNFVGGE